MLATGGALSRVVASSWVGFSNRQASQTVFHFAFDSMHCGHSQVPLCGIEATGEQVRFDDFFPMEFKLALISFTLAEIFFASSTRRFGLRPTLVELVLLSFWSTG